MSAEIKYVTKVSEGTDFRGVGGLVKRLVHPSLNGSVNLGVSIAFVNPGEELPFHKHSNEEAYFVLQGTGLMKIKGYDEDIQLEPWLSVYMPGNSEHYTKNTGNEPLVLLCSLAPPPAVSAE